MPDSFPVLPSEMADVVWLAMQLGLEPEAQRRQDDPGRTDLEPDRVVRPPDPPAPDPGPRAHPGPSEARPPVLPAPAEPGTSVRPVRVASFRRPAETRELARALRLFSRRMPSRHRVVMDEELTAEKIATDGLFVPAFRPAPERRFHLCLVVDDAPSMQLWADLVSRLERVLRQFGGFRYLRRYTFDSSEAEMTVRGASKPVRARELVDPERRRLFVVVSDMVGEGWHDRRVPDLLRQWSGTCPVALLQVLPQSMWDRTGLARCRKVRIRVPDQHPFMVGVTESRLGRPKRVRHPYPLLTMNPASWSRWASLLTLPTQASIPGVDFLEGAGRSSLPDDPQERVERFMRLATPTARRLASLLSAASLQSEVVRSVQALGVPESGPEHLGELVLEGVLEAGEGGLGFFPGVRGHLLERAPLDESLAVFHHSLQARGQGELFDVLLEQPGEMGRLPADLAEVGSLLLREPTVAPPQETPLEDGHASPWWQLAEYDENLARRVQSEPPEAWSSRLVAWLREVPPASGEEVLRSLAGRWQPTWDEATTLGPGLSLRVTVGSEPLRRVLTAINPEGNWHGTMDQVIQAEAGDQFHAWARKHMPLHDGQAIVARGRTAGRLLECVVFVVDGLSRPLDEVVTAGLEAAAEAGLPTLSIPGIRLGTMRGKAEREPEALAALARACTRHGESRTTSLRHLALHLDEKVLESNRPEVLAPEAPLHLVSLWLWLARESPAVLREFASEGGLEGADLKRPLGVLESMGVETVGRLRTLISRAAERIGARNALRAVTSTRGPLGRQALALALLAWDGAEWRIPEEVGPWSDLLRHAASLRSAWRAPKVLLAGTGVLSSLTEEQRVLALELGRNLARAGCVLIVGGWPGVDSLAAEGYAQVASERGLDLREGLVQVMPPGMTPEGPVGQLIHASEEYTDSVARADAVVLVGGAGGTIKVFHEAVRQGKAVLPLPSTGGDAALAWRMLQGHALSYDLNRLSQTRPEPLWREVLLLIEELMDSSFQVAYSEGDPSPFGRVWLDEGSAHLRSDLEASRLLTVTEDPAKAMLRLSGDSGHLRVHLEDRELPGAISLYEYRDPAASVRRVRELLEQVVRWRWLRDLEPRPEARLPSEGFEWRVQGLGLPEGGAPVGEHGLDLAQPERAELVLTLRNLGKPPLYAAVLDLCQDFAVLPLEAPFDGERPLHGTESLRFALEIPDDWRVPGSYRDTLKLLVSDEPLGAFVQSRRQGKLDLDRSGPVPTLSPGVEIAEGLRPDPGPADLPRTWSAQAVRVNLQVPPPARPRTLRALIVGIDGYREEPLRGCVDAARAVHDYLEEGPTGVEARLLLDEQATRSALADGFLGHLRSGGEGDVGFFYFAGRATRQWPFEGEDAEEGGGLELWDTGSGGRDAPPFLDEIELLVQQAVSSGLSHFLAILDADVGQLRVARWSLESTEPRPVVVLTSGSARQEFTRLMLSILREYRGDITYNELFGRLREKLDDPPTLSTVGTGDGPLLFLDGALARRDRDEPQFPA